MPAIGAPMKSRLQVVYVISAFFAGLAGALSAQTTQFVALDALPLTSNGKPDRPRLLAWLDAPPALAQNEEGLTEWEAIVAGIWQELLGIDGIQASDNFYDLGGHSLMAIQVVSALERRARVQISPRDLVFHTLRQFAALCMSKSVSEDGTQTSHV